MTVKTVTLPSGEKIAFGRKPSPPRRRALKLRQYLAARVAALVPPPAVEDYAPKTVKGSGLAMGLGNYELGDCTCAAAGHIEDIFRAHDGDGLPPITNEEAIALYCEACGYVKGDPSTDNGGTLAEVLAEWKSYGIPGTNASIAGFLTVDPTNQVEVEQAIYLFGNLYIGLSLPDAWINPMPSASGFTWSVAGPPDPSSGHCVAVYGYNEEGVFINTWGLFGTITWGAFAKYLNAAAGGEVYAVLSEDWVSKATGLAPNGLNYAELEADLASG